MPRKRQEVEEQRGRVFRRMEWFYVYLPPLLLGLVLLAGGALLAWGVRIGDTPFWQRWLLGSLFLGAAGAILYGIQAWLERKEQG